MRRGVTIYDTSGRLIHSQAALAQHDKGQRGKDNVKRVGAPALCASYKGMQQVYVLIHMI